jgi:hypothetical protein
MIDSECTHHILNNTNKLDNITLYKHNDNRKVFLGGQCKFVLNRIGHGVNRYLKDVCIISRSKYNFIPTGKLNEQQIFTFIIADRALMYNTITLELVLSGTMVDDGLYYLGDETIGPPFEEIVEELIKRKKNKSIGKVTLRIFSIKCSLHFFFFFFLTTRKRKPFL